MKTVRQSTEECNKFNSDNAEAIACGLVEEITPDQYIIEREQADRKRAEAQAVEDKAKAAIMAQVAGLNSQAKDFCYIAAVGRSYNRTWRLYIGKRWGQDRTWVQLNSDLSPMTIWQLAKAKSKILEEIADREARAAQQVIIQNANDAWKNFLAVEENKAFAMRVTQQAWLSEYTPEMIFKGDLISYKGNSFTRAQWTAICDLRDANRKALEDLKASFAAANK